MSPDLPREAALYLDPATGEPEVWALAGGVAAVYSDRCPGSDAPNQDAAALIPVADRAAVLVVADGVGGMRGGEQASGIAVRSLVTALADASGENLRGAILDGIERANREVQELGLGAGTTLAAAEIHEGAVRPYHVGDSMVLVVGQRGKIKLQTVAHSPVGFALAAGVIDEREAIHHEELHVVSNLLGSADMRIEVGSRLALARRDTVLLASDGLLDNLHGGEIVECIRKGDLADAARRLAEKAKRRMDTPDTGQPSKPDDLSFVLFRLE